MHLIWLFFFSCSFRQIVTFSRMTLIVDAIAWVYWSAIFILILKLITQSIHLDVYAIRSFGISFRITLTWVNIYTKKVKWNYNFFFQVISSPLFTESLFDGIFLNFFYGGHCELTFESMIERVSSTYWPLNFYLRKISFSVRLMSPLSLEWNTQIFFIFFKESMNPFIMKSAHYLIVARI